MISLVEPPIFLKADAVGTRRPKTYGIAGGCLAKASKVGRQCATNCFVAIPAGARRCAYDRVCRCMSYVCLGHA